MSSARPSTVAALVRARAEDDNVGLVLDDRRWTWREVVAESAVRAAWLRSALDPARPPHVGVMLPNTPEFVFTLLGAALAGVCVVGVNPTRRGAELQRDVTHTACQFVLADETYADLLPGVVRVEDRPWADFAGAGLPPNDPDPDALLVLLFTSGSTSAPKAVKRSQGGVAAGPGMPFGPDDVLYCAMPLFHGNALFSNLLPGLAGGSRIVLRERFTATRWLDDVRAHGVTFTNTVGRALGYVLATPPTGHDRDNRLRFVLAPEASPRDAAAFTERFGAYVVAGYGSSEGGIVLQPARKPGSLGVAPEGVDIAIVDPETGAECPPARFDERGRLLNAQEAIGEIVRRGAAGSFEGYWDNPEADADRLRDGCFFSGDLGYRDADGVFWFAGRLGDWLRVDSENFAAGPVERILARCPGVSAVAVVGVPDPLAGDQVLAAVEPDEGGSFDAVRFAAFLDAQADLGTKWAPRFVRVCDRLPTTGNDKIDKRPLRAAAWMTTDPVWWRPPRAATYRLMTDADRAALAAEFAAHGRAGAHPAG